MEVISVPDTGFSLEPKPAEDPAVRDENLDKGLVAEAERTKKSMGASAVRMAQQTFTQKPKKQGVDTTKMSTEERGKWQSLVLTLTRYGASRRFGDQLRSFGFTLTASRLRQHTIEELEDMLDRARVCCQQATVEGMFSQAALSAVGFAEAAIGNTPGLRDKVLLSGLTEGLKQDEGFMSALEQLSIDYGSFVACPPEYRLMMAFTAAAGRTHALNLFMRKRGEMVAAATKEATKEAEESPVSISSADAEEVVMPKASAPVGAIRTHDRLKGAKGAGKPAVK
jgi:hypothetical protein